MSCQRTGQRECGSSIQRILLSHKKNEICHRMNMDGFQGYYPKSEKDKYMVSLHAE